MDYYGFYSGKLLNVYEFLGCHIDENGAIFRVFAPAAARVTVTGEFNHWNETDLYRIHNGHFWECHISAACAGMMYKYKLYLSNGSCIEHCDPYGYGMELRPQFASIIRDLSSYTFHDEKWMKSRTDCKNKPLNIYEVHSGSW